MSILNINTLAPELSYPGFWNQRRLIYLAAILKARKPKRKSISLKQLPNLQREIELQFKSLCSDDIRYSFDKNEKQRCNEVLYFLSLNGWRCHYFVTQKKLPRPSITAPSSEALLLWQMGQGYLDAFWSGRTKLTSEAMTLAFLIELFSYSSLSLSAFHRVLQADIRQCFQNDSGRLIVPLDPSAQHQISIRLSGRQQLLLNTICNKDNFNSTKFQKLLHQPALPLLSALSGEYVTIEQNCSPETTVEQLLRVSGYQAPFHGIEPILMSTLAKDQIPVSIQNKELNPQIYRPEFVRHISNLTPLSYDESTHPKTSQQKPDAEQTQPDVEPIESASENTYLHESLAWNTECQLTIRRIRNVFRKSLTDASGTFINDQVDPDLVDQTLKPAKKNTLQRTQERALENQLFAYEQEKVADQIELIDHSITGLDLALEYIYYHLVELENTFDTCFKEISAIFLHGFLAYEPGWNLQQWDEEDFELLTSEYILARGGRTTENETTRQQTVSSLNRVVRIARDRFGLFKNLDIPKLTTQGRVFTSRNNIVTLKEFDALIETTEELDSAILILAFYAGMRSGEIISLSLNDVANSHNELTVYVREGKTPAAKRAIPLHRLMPKSLMRKVQSVIELREIDYRKFMRGKSASRNIDRARANFKVFVRSEISGHKSGQVILSETRETLRDRLGRKADLHLLRHSFASWFFLRWYAAKHPEFIDSLTNNDHWLFGTEGIKQIKQFFGVFTPGPLPSDHSNAMIYFIKLFGHANTATLFQVYIHTYDFVLDHALKNAYRGADSEPMKGNLIAELVPKMKSRATQSKLRDRSANALIKLVETKNRSS